MNSSTSALAQARPMTASRKILRAAVVVGSFTLLAKLGTTAKELAVAQWFGRGDALDAFLIAYLLPAFLVSIVAASLGAALIPTFIHLRETEGDEAAQRLLSNVTACSLGVLVAVSVGLVAFAPFLLSVVASGFGPAKLALTRRLLYVLTPYVVVSGTGMIWAAVLNAKERFALAAFLPILEPATAVLFLLLGGRAWGIMALAVGTLVGKSLEAGLLGSALRRQGLRIVPRWQGVDSNLRMVMGQSAPLVAGSVLTTSSLLVDQSMAAFLRAGSVAALNYGSKIVSGVVGVGNIALSTAAFPYFSQMAAKRDWKQFRQTLRTFSLLIVAVTVPVAIAVAFFSHGIVRLLFQRGAFTAADTRVVARVLAFLVLQIPFYMIGVVGIRIISALRRNVVLMVIAGVNLVMNIVLDYLFMKFAGVAGIALSTSVVTFMSCSLITTAVLMYLKRHQQAGAQGS